MRAECTMANVGREEIERFASLPYAIELWPCEEGGFFVEIPDLPGCMSQGETAEEAFEMIEDAKRGWIEIHLEDGHEVPLPRSDSDFSGKFVVRVPGSLHRAIVSAARRDGVSMNAFVTMALAKEVGRRA
jgi:antitoxin HicB